MHPIISTSYVFLEARSVIEGAGFVMSTQSPFNLGRVLTFKDRDTYLTSMTNSSWPVLSVPGYMILIQFAGSLLNGRRMLVSDPDMGEIKTQLSEMCDFYYQEKVSAHTGRYKKYLL